MTPKISVIIPAYNEEKYLPTTLEKLQEQDMQQFEVIVVPNGCEDNTHALAIDAGLRSIPLAQANVCWARNTGATHARAPLLLFLDADVHLDSQALGKMLTHFEQQHSVATTRTRPDRQGLLYNGLTGFKNLYLRSKLYKGCSGALLCRKEDFHAVGGYNPKITVGEHRDLISRLLTKGSFTCVPTTAVASMRRLEQWGFWKTISFWLFDRTPKKYEKVR